MEDRNASKSYVYSLRLEVSNKHTRNVTKRLNNSTHSRSALVFSSSEHQVEDYVKFLSEGASQLSIKGTHCL